jgi:hypothetical protein
MFTQIVAFAFMLVTALSSGGYSAANDWVIREDGVGPVKVGMTVSQLNKILHEKFSFPEQKEDQPCFYVNPAKHPHISFMIEDGRLARVDVDAPGTPTAEGVQVGDSELRAKRVYGPRLKIEPHAYTGPVGHYLTIRSKDGRYGIRFETDGKKIDNLYAGRMQAVEYIEGCL